MRTYFKNIILAACLVLTACGDSEGESPEVPQSIIPTTGPDSPLSYPNMTLVWQDEFDGTELNASNWTYELGTGSNGWGNNELQYYTDKNTQILEGNLVITAKKESLNGSNFTSSRIVTKDKQEFEYGRIDIRAALPEGQGLWPALWMMGSNFNQVGWPRCGEIDIMEMVGGNGRENTVLGTVHWLDDNSGQRAQFGGTRTLPFGTFNDAYHVFSIVWDETSIEWLVDGNQYHVIDTTPAELDEFRNSFFFIFNVAVGGTLPGNPDTTTSFPQHMIVDYVRVFQSE